jgi:transcriptional regulator of acetoin/glycerol metabolism
VTGAPASRSVPVGSVAYARERFLAAEAVGDQTVRRLILSSWKRSQDHKVDSDRVAVPYVRDPDLETPLARSAAPILDALHEQLSGEPVSIILTDHAGLVVDRRCASSSIARSLDSVQLAPGFSYAEEYAGTNGIGTALSSSRPALVDGREHYTGELGRYACAGAPIHHPTQRRVIGLLDLTTWAQTSGSMLMALANATAQQIEEELLAQTGLREFALFQEYLKACQRSNGAVLALNNDVVMMNEHLRQIMDAQDQHALIGHSADTMLGSTEVMRTVELPSGLTANLRYTPAISESGPAGGVFNVRLAHPPVRPAGSAGTGGPAVNLPGLVGGPAWTKSAMQVSACYDAGDWVAVEGERGTGKLSLLRAVHRLRNPAGHWRVLDPPEDAKVAEWLALVAEELQAPNGLLVLAHADRLGEQAVRGLLDTLHEGTDDGDPGSRSRVAITLDVPNARNDVDELLPLFPRTIELTSLRHRGEDVSELVPYLLAQLGRSGALTCSAQALAVLQRCAWPGNVTQLRRVLADIAKRRHAGVIQVEDLPPECRVMSRRVLTRIESLERDAIVQSLVDSGANVASAAQKLGMSRATIYRKIRNYGIHTSTLR